MFVIIERSCKKMFVYNWPETSTVVELSTTDPKVEGLNPPAARLREIVMDKKIE